MRKQELLSGSLFTAAKPWCVVVFGVFFWGGWGGCFFFFFFFLVLFPSPGSV